MRKKHKTPKHLDYLFQRHIIGKKDYSDFWEGYWDKTSRDRFHYIDDYVSKIQLSIPFVKRKKAGSITTSRKAAEEQAKNIDGYVARVTKNGRRSKHGRFFRAFPKKRKTK